MAAATAWRTWPALGSSERCSIDANKASAQTALVLGRYISSCISQPPDRFATALTTLEKVGAGGVRLMDQACHRSSALRGTAGHRARPSSISHSLPIQVSVRGYEHGGFIAVTRQQRSFHLSIDTRP